MSNVDKIFMKKALQLARKGLGRTSPNPMVGAVIVRNGKVIASGYHRKAGENHAEVEALSDLRSKADAGDTLYVTLEPCNHHGKTPPCTEAILRSGIRQVVIGMTDPNPNISGRGEEYLRKNGVEVRKGVLEKECRKLNEVFIKYIKTEGPYVIAKTAMTLDGWTATATGDSKWITNERSRKFVHQLRDSVDAVMVGAGTVISDDPSLTTRLGRGKGRDPIRIILDTHFAIPHGSKVLNQESDSRTLIVVSGEVTSVSKKAVEKDNVSFITCPIKDGVIDLKSLLDILGKMSITSVMVEGGSNIMGSMIRQRLIDKFYIFKAPKILGGSDAIPMAEGLTPSRMDESHLIEDISLKRFGDDILIIGYAECLPD
ncbi:bifunctional diaminohydroxyphosphoribosylaminopyrimidine deaminase/5-amino-6-(5-phosphoribosylamino)uracil reductase RibD [Thermodesulfobacteriota bacterium]